MWFNPAQLTKSADYPVATFATPATFQPQTMETAPKVAEVAKVASTPSAETATASRWWLIHYPDGAPVEVWTSPPATWAEILESRPDAVAAEPIRQGGDKLSLLAQDLLNKYANNVPSDFSYASCSTCTHVTYRGGCGEPVDAGLSSDVGVIRYHDQGGKDCTAWRGPTQAVGAF